MLDVNYAGKEKSFETVADAVEFMDSLNCGSDLWYTERRRYVLLRTRMEQSNGTFKITDCFPTNGS
jgi:hypothetical protein